MLRTVRERLQSEIARIADKLATEEARVRVLRSELRAEREATPFKIIVNKQFGRGRLYGVQVTFDMDALMFGAFSSRVENISCTIRLISDDLSRKVERAIRDELVKDHPQAMLRGGAG